MNSDTSDSASHRPIPSYMVEEAVACGRRCGFDVGELIADHASQSPSTQRYTKEEFGLLWRTLSLAMDDEYLGMGERPMPLGATEFLSKALLNSSDFADGLQRAMEFMRLVIGRPRARLEAGTDFAEIVFDREAVAPSPFAFHLYWIIIGGVLGWLIGRRILFKRAAFQCTPPAADSDYREFLRAPTLFDQVETRLTFDSSYLALANIRDEQSLSRFAPTLPTGLLTRYWTDLTLAGAIRERLTQAAPHAWPVFEELAHDLGYPASSLRRKLRAEGSSYSSIKDDHRRILAIRALLHSERSIEQISEDLGFAEPSAFHRAFRKWMACSPGAFRRGSEGSQRATESS